MAAREQIAALAPAQAGALGQGTSAPAPAGAALRLASLAQRLDPTSASRSPAEAHGVVSQFIDDVEAQIDEMMRLVDHAFPPIDPPDRMQETFGAVKQRMVELFVEARVRAPIPWHDVSVADRGLIRAAMRAGLIGFDDRGQLHRLSLGDAPPRPQVTPFYVFGLMLSRQGRMHPVFEVNGLFDRVVKRGDRTTSGAVGSTENAQQAILSVLWNAQRPLTSDDLAEQAGVPIDELASPLRLFTQHEIVRRESDGRWVMVRYVVAIKRELLDIGYSFSAGPGRPWHHRPMSLHMVQFGHDRGDWTSDNLREAERVLRHKGGVRTAKLFAALADMLDAKGSVETIVELNEGATINLGQ